MTGKSIWRGVLIALLSVALATQSVAGQSPLAARPDLLNSSSGGSLQKLGDEIVIGIVVVAVAVAVIVVVLVTHRPQKVTGCVISGPTG